LKPPCIAIPLCLAIHDPTSLHFNDGGFYAVKTSFFQYFQIGLIGFAIASVLGLFLWTMAKNWKYTSWNKNKVPYIQLMDDAIILFGDTQIPWSSISYVRSVKFDFRGPYRTYIVLGLSPDLQRDRLSIPHLERLTKRLKLVTSLIRKKYNIELGKNEFLCIPLDDQNGLTLPSDEIVALVEQFWNMSDFVTEECVEGRFVNPTAIEYRHSIDQTKGRTALTRAIIYRAIVWVSMTTFFLVVSVRDIHSNVKMDLARENWPSVVGTVIRSKIASACTDSAKNIPDIQYNYSVSGVDYVGEKIDGIDLGLKSRDTIVIGRGSHNIDLPVMGNRCVLQNDASNLISQYPVGSTVSAYYNPRAPNEAILVKTGISFVTWTEIVTVSVIIFALAFIVTTYSRIAFGIWK
jgi:hypothetical protein